MLFIFINILLSVVLAGLIHELGHYLVALTFGHHLVFRRQAYGLFGICQTTRHNSGTSDGLSVLCGGLQ